MVFWVYFFMKIFTEDLKVIEIGSNYLKIAALFIPAFTTLQISISLMQGLKKPISWYMANKSQLQRLKNIYIHKS